MNVNELKFAVDIEMNVSVSMQEYNDLNEKAKQQEQHPADFIRNAILDAIYKGTKTGA